MDNVVKKRVVIYGLGQSYINHKVMLHEMFEVIGGSDKCSKPEGIRYIEREDIKNYSFDYCVITIGGLPYRYEAREELIALGVPEYKIKHIFELLYDWNPVYREEWTIEKLQEIPAGKILLDAGAGEMTYAPYCKHLKYIAQDFGQYDPNETEEGMDFHLKKWDTSRVNIVSDIIDMPILEESVDVVLCTEVFEHIKNPVLAVKEFARVLKPNGKLILTAPFCAMTHMAPYFYSSGFSKYWYNDVLGDYGFEIDEITANGDYFSYLAVQLWHTEKVIRHYCNDEISLEDAKTLSDGINLMRKYSKKDTTSCESLCDNYLVLAHKKWN